MRVVLQHNLDPDIGLVNGSQGTVVGFEEYDPARLPKKGRGSDDGPAIGDAQSLMGSHARYRQEEIKIFAERDNNRQPWPIVQFDNGLERTIYADCAVNEIGDSPQYSLLSRTQISAHGWLCSYCA